MKILLVEDQPDLLEFLKELLSSYGYTPHGSASADDFFELAETFRPDLVLLDIGLPGKSGLELLQDLKLHPRYHSLPVIILSGQTSEETMSFAYDSGADDFVVKPFVASLLVRKIRAVIKRCRHLGRQLQRSLSDIQIDFSQQKAFIEGRPVQLTMTELNILRELLDASGQVVSRQNLISSALGGVAVTDRTIDVHVCSLRKKLTSRGAKIETVRGRGYRISA